MNAIDTGRGFPASQLAGRAPALGETHRPGTESSTAGAAKPRIATGFSTQDRFVCYAGDTRWREFQPKDEDKNLWKRGLVRVSTYRMSADEAQKLARGTGSFGDSFTPSRGGAGPAR